MLLRLSLLFFSFLAQLVLLVFRELLAGGKVTSGLGNLLCFLFLLDDEGGQLLEDLQLLFIIRNVRQVVFEFLLDLRQVSLLYLVAGEELRAGVFVDFLHDVLVSELILDFFDSLNVGVGYLAILVGLTLFHVF